MKCEYCDNPVPKGVTRCPSCGASISVEQPSVSLREYTQIPSVAESRGRTQVPFCEDKRTNSAVRKMRVIYVLLGFFFGAIGLHNFYAGYKCRAVVQLLISILSFGILAVISWIWAVVEIIVVNEDGQGRPFV